MSERGDPLAELRTRIGENDRAIVEAVNERLRLVAQPALVSELLALTKRELDR